MVQTLITPDPTRTSSGLTADDLLHDKIQSFSLLRRPKQTDYAILKQMFYAMIGRTGPSARRKFAILLAHNPYTPRQLLLFLALESIDVATPILMYSPALSERDLIAIAERKGSDHACIIARRDNLTPRVATALMDLGGEVAETLRRNKSAPELPRLEVGREAPSKPEKPLETSQTIKRVKTIPSKPIASSESTDATSKLLDLAGKSGRLGRRLPETPQKADWLSPAATGRAMLEAARSGRTVEFCLSVERATGLASGKLARVIRDEDAGILASLFHLMRLPKDKSARLLLMLCPKTGRSVEVFRKVMDRFDGLDDKAALAYFKAMEPDFKIAVSRHHIVEPMPEYMPMLRQRRTQINRLARQADASPMQQAS